MANDHWVQRSDPMPRGRAKGGHVHCDAECADRKGGGGGWG